MPTPSQTTESRKRKKGSDVFVAKEEKGGGDHNSMFLFVMCTFGKVDTIVTNPLHTFSKPIINFLERVPKGVVNLL